MENNIKRYKYLNQEIFEDHLKSIINLNDLDIDDYKPKQTLNEEIWVNLNMNDDVRKYMLYNAYEFIKFLKIPSLKINDIILTGSIANYNWNEYSDIDIHILFDFNQISNNKEFVTEYLNTKKDLWNDTHNISIKGFDVEMYCQDVNEKHTSTGVFSIINNKWNSVPIKQIISLDVNNIKQKVISFINIFDNISEIKDPEILSKNIIKLKDKLKKYRKSGLDSHGEYSTENIVYKILRKLGYINNLYELKNKIIDNKLTLENEKM